MVSKATLVRAFAIIVIASFVLELFIVVLSSGGSSASSSVTNPTELPSVNPADLSAGLPGASGNTVLFVGLGRANGTVTGFDVQNVLQCPAFASGSTVAARLGRVPGVSNARDYGSGVFGFQFAANATPQDFATLALSVQAVSQPECPEGNATVYRLARVSFTDPTVTLASATGAKTQVLSTRAINTFFASIGRPTLALSPIGVQANQSVALVVSAQLHNGALVAAQGDSVNLIVQLPPLSPSPTLSTSGGVSGPNGAATGPTSAASVDSTQSSNGTSTVGASSNASASNSPSPSNSSTVPSNSPA